MQNKSDIAAGEDKAGSSYWENAWSQASIPEPVNPRTPGLNNLVKRRFHERFTRVLEGLGADHTLLEIGCAKSAWLPYFAREFGFRIAGLDYSPTGCKLAEETLHRAGVDGRIVCGDFLTPPPDMLEAYGVVFSYGVAEHFSDTTGCIRAFSRFLRPGGLMVTVVPNMYGMVGWLQRLVDRAVYDIHVPLDRVALEKAHREAGMNIECTEYFISIDLGVTNAERWRGTLFYRTFVRARSWITKGVWILESLTAAIPPNSFTSPYIICVARNPKD